MNKKSNPFLNPLETHYPPPGRAAIEEYLEEKGVTYLAYGKWKKGKHAYRIAYRLELSLKLWSHVVERTLREMAKRHRYHYYHHIVSFHPDNAKINVLLEQ